MRLKMHFLLAAFLSGLAATGAQAGEAGQDCPPPPHGPGGPHAFDRLVPGPGPHFRVRMPLFDFDLDKDGRISRAEIDRGLKTRFDEADDDDDGELDPEEFADAMPRPPDGPPRFGGPMPPPGAGPCCECGPRHGRHGRPGHPPRHDRGPPSPKDAFDHLDWNLDGALSFEEYAAPIHQMALRMDRDGNGVIDRDELKQPATFFGPGFGPPPAPPREH
jgi:hypothetical protein